MSVLIWLFYCKCLFSYDCFTANHSHMMVCCKWVICILPRIYLLIIILHHINENTNSAASPFYTLPSFFPAIHELYHFITLGNIPKSTCSFAAKRVRCLTDYHKFFTCTLLALKGLALTADGQYSWTTSSSPCLLSHTMKSTVGQQRPGLMHQSHYQTLDWWIIMKVFLGLHWCPKDSRGGPLLVSWSSWPGRHCPRCFLCTQLSQ